MEYLVKQCPKCRGELHIPENLKTCICMFCGETFTLHSEAEGEEPDVSQQMMEEEYRNSLEGISRLIENLEQYLSNFTRNNYSSSFNHYVQIGSSVLQAAEQYAVRFIEYKDKVVEETAQALIDEIEKGIAGTSGGILHSAQNNQIYQSQFFLAVYTVPMISSLDYSISEPLAECIVEKWHNRYPKSEFKKASYDNLQSGFERKGFCFITSAVCETMNKGDDCNELTAFRNFRDTFMQQTKERQASVEEYYNIAPAIVASIDLLTDCKEKYKMLWKEYLQPCFNDLKEGNLEQCEKDYTRMVKDLKKEYHISSILGL
jgi:hypothetical protein